MRLSPVQKRVLVKLLNRTVSVGLNVSHSTARALLRAGLVTDYTLSEYGDSAGTWGIELTDDGRRVAKKLAELLNGKR